MPHWKMSSACSTASPILSVLMMLLPFASVDAATPSQQRTPPRLEITIEGSRSYITAGSGPGITAEIKNASETDVVYLYEKHLTLMPPPELLPPQKIGISLATSAVFPTEGNRDEGWRGKANYRTIAIKPGESYKAQFPDPFSDNVNHFPTEFVKDSVSSYVWNKLNSDFAYLLFTPGDYKIPLVAKYWTHPPKATELDATLAELEKHPECYDYHSSVANTMLHVAAPQTVIMFGAVVGGLVAYVVFPKARAQVSEKDPWWRRLRKHVIALLGACLLSGIVTILLSRVSESQFLIRVTVSDVWGAIAIGFVANYLGSRILDSLLKNWDTPDKENKATKEQREPSQDNQVTKKTEPPQAPAVTSLVGGGN